MLALFKKYLTVKNELDRYVILKHDDQGFYIEYAFTEGSPHDNRCLSWYDSYQENAYIRNNWFKGQSEETAQKSKETILNARLNKIGKIFELSSFTCGWEEHPDLISEKKESSWIIHHKNDPYIKEDHICQVGRPSKQCIHSHCPHWTYDEPVKCACWHLSTELNVDEIQNFKAYLFLVFL